MKASLLFASLLILFVVAPIRGQQPAASPAPKSGQEDVVRVTTNLVQLDVVVVDKDGKRVTDLTPEDFEITEDRDKQKITSFSYVALGPGATVSQPTSSTAKVGTTIVVPAPLRPEQVHRTIALVVDDLGISFESIVSVKEALRKFVNEQMQPNDLVAILRTSRGIGSLQQFTSNKGQLLAAIDNINWFASGRSGLSPNPQIDTQVGQDSIEGAQVVNDMEEARAATYSVGTIQTLSRILQGLKELPGRKSIMLYSESFQLFTSQGRNVQLLQALKNLTDLANQASTVIYTIDTSGLNPLDMTASDRVKGLSYTFNPEDFNSVTQPRTHAPTRRADSPSGSLSAQAEGDSVAAFRRLEALMQQKENSQYQAQTVLSLLAEDTGGTFTKNTNNLSLGTQRMLENESGYYLIGYRPEDTTIDPATGRRRFHEIKVKVKRSGLRVRSRAGFYGVNLEGSTNSRTRTRDQQLTAALVSPFAASGIGLRVTPLFGNDPAQGSYLRVLLHINAQDLTFSAQPDGSRKAMLDVVAVNFGSEGRAVDQFSDTQTINVKEAGYQQMLKDGLIFVLNVPAKKPGPMQLRVAVRDTTSERVGSASQFVQAPDLTKNRLALSGLFLSGTEQKPAVAAGQTDGQQTAMEDPLAGPAVRQLRQGMILNYAYTIYNAQLDASGKPQLQTQMRLFRDGSEVFTGKQLPYSVGQQTDMKRLGAGGRLLVGGNLPPGQYVLQVTVTDALAKNKRQGVTAQWIDFEIVK